MTSKLHNPFPGLQLVLPFLLLEQLDKDSITLQILLPDKLSTHRALGITSEGKNYIITCYR